MRAIRESFLHEIMGHAAPTYVEFQAIRESFLREILTSYGSAKVFSLESLPLYGICAHSCLRIANVHAQLMDTMIIQYYASFFNNAQRTGLVHH